MEAATLVRKRAEEYLPQKKRRTDLDVRRFCKKVEDVKPQQQAFDYSDGIDGVPFAEDYGNAKQYLVARNHDDMYDFVFNEELDKLAPAVFGLVFILELDNVPLAVLGLCLL